MPLAELIQPKCIKVPLSGKTKEEVIDELIGLLVEQGQVQDAEACRQAVWQRERTRTTGIGHGLAIPHGKTSACDQLAMAVGKPLEPVDFGSIDGRPVRIIFLLASPPEQTGPHIQALAQISRLMAREELRRRALEATDARDLYELIAHQENVVVE